MITLTLQIHTCVIGYIPYTLILCATGRLVTIARHLVLCPKPVFKAITSAVPRGQFASINVQVVPNYDSCCLSVMDKHLVLHGSYTHKHGKNDDGTTNLKFLWKRSRVR
jgi:hypothetical protein